MNNLKAQSSEVDSKQAGLPKSSLSFLLFYIGTILLFIDFLRNSIDMFGQIFPAPVRTLSLTMGPLVMLFSAVVAVNEGQLGRIKATYRNWLLLLLLVLVLLLVSGILIFNNGIRLVLLDFFLFPTLFAGILVGTKEKNWISFDKLIFFIFMISLFYCIFNLKYLVEVASISTRLDRYDIIIGSNSASMRLPMIYSFWGNLVIWPYFFLTIKNRSIFSKMVIILGIIVFFTMAVIYQKRISFLHLMLFIFLFLIKTDIKKWLKIAVLLFVSGIVIWNIFSLVAGENKEGFVERFEKRFNKYDTGIADTFKQEDYIAYDPKLVFTQFSGLEFIMGRGLGGVVKDVFNLYPDELTASLHNGSALLMLKGGIVLLIIWWAGWLLVTKDFIINRYLYLNRYYIPIMIIFLLSWVGTFISRGVIFAFIMMCAGRVMSRDIKPSSTSK